MFILVYLLTRSYEILAIENNVELPFDISVIYFMTGILVYVFIFSILDRIFKSSPSFYLDYYHVIAKTFDGKVIYDSEKENIDLDVKPKEVTNDFSSYNDL